MQQATRNYQILARRFVTLPLILTLLVTFCIFLLVNLHHTMSKEIEHASTINHLLAQTESSQNPLLITKQVTNLLKLSSNIENVIFYPINQPQTISNEKLTIQQLFFGKYHGLKTPVFINQSLSGYMIMTVDLSKIRQQWLKKSSSMFVIILLLILVTLIIISKFLNKHTQNLPILEQISLDVLNNQDAQIPDLAVEHTNQHGIKEPLQLVQEAFIHLLNQQKQNFYGLQQAKHLNQQLKEQQLQIIQQNSIFQNTLNHEFKSSLSKIMSGTRLLESQYISAEQQDAVNMINSAIEALNTKLTQLQLMNHLEKNQVGIHLSSFSPTRLIQDVIRIYESKIHEKELKLFTKFHHADFILSGDIQKITLIISSLLDNAIKFTDEGSITITSAVQHLSKSIRWQITIQDTGIGIAQQYHKQIFEPFFQIHPERRHSYHSQNIGLYLVKKLTEMMNGTIEFSSDEGDGSTFHLILILDDWNTYQQQLTLQNKQITLWHNNNNHKPDTHAIKDTGATLTTFTDHTLLLNHLLNHTTDVLLISSDVNPKTLIKLVKQIREHEKHHRVLIVYYYLPQFGDYLKELQIIGVDYLEKAKTDEHFSQDYLTNLLHYIH